MAARSAPPLTLVLVRHGETEGNSSVRYHGRSNVALSDLGRTQMRAARREIERRFGARAFSHVFSSPLSRALEGAKLIAGAAVPIVTVKEFTEVDFGFFEGLTAEEIHARYPEEFARWRARRLAPSYVYPGGESRAAFTERVERGLERLLKTVAANGQRAPARALVVAHRGVIRAMVRALTDAEPVVELASIHLLERDGRWRARLLDLTTHLAVA
jgi:broad specificity phosphatase PhoE